MYSHAILNTPMRIKATKTRNHYDSIEFSPECLPCFTHLASHRQRTGGVVCSIKIAQQAGQPVGMGPAHMSTDGCQQPDEGHNFQCHYLQREPLHSSLIGSRQRAGFEHLIRHLDQAKDYKISVISSFILGSVQLPPVQVMCASHSSHH